MEMEVVIPIRDMDFDFNSARSSPRHISAPSTPKRFGEYYFSAPTSPSRISQFYRDFDDLLMINGGENGYQTEGGSAAAVPFDWEEKPGKPKSTWGGPNHEDDFAFAVSEDFDTASVSAEELFDGGVIKPLKPPPGLQLPSAAKINASAQSIPPISPRSHGRKVILGAFSPRHKKESGPFGTAAQKSTRRTPERERGRERRAPGISSSSRRATRSLSPLRVSEYPWEEEDQQQPNKEQSPMSTKPYSSPNNACSSLSSSSSSKNFKKWSFKDFFLFRSASEGRATDKDPFRKYTAFRRYDEVKISSTRAIESAGSGSMSRRTGPVSAHELHYTINRAVSEDMKKKTFLPYKQGILGRLAFNPAVHALANGFGFSRN